MLLPAYTNDGDVRQLLPSIIVRPQERLWYGISMTVDKAHENRVRRAAERQGLTLSKSRIRDPLALRYGWYIYRGKRELAHFRELDGAERWLADPASRVKAG